MPIPGTFDVLVATLGHTPMLEWAQLDNLCKVANTDYAIPFSLFYVKGRGVVNSAELQAESEVIGLTCQGTADQQPFVRHRQPQPQGTEPIQNLQSRLQSRRRRRSLRTIPRSFLRRLKVTLRFLTTAREAFNSSINTDSTTKRGSRGLRIPRKLVKRVSKKLVHQDDSWVSRTAASPATLVDAIVRSEHHLM